ncbi:Na+/H+ antiporter subunit C [Pseudoxanthomonas mexicana]|uniref:Na+/H+ antiporter subunit C n=1 Tax=Pseudoxanthomonas mexicana TaxID=128785 RepID=UPI00398A6D1A
MELALASAIGILTAAGVYLLLRPRSFDVIIGMTLLSYATNLLIFCSGRLVMGKAPVLREGVAPTLANYADPLPQALVLTAIVIAFAMTAVTIVLAIRNRADNHSDHVDAGRPGLAGAPVRPKESADAADGAAEPRA